jgi:hypothetical protein
MHIAGDDGQPAFLNPVYDTTRQVVAERRLSTLLALTPPSTFSLRLQDAWAHIATTIQHHSRDLPLVAIYSNAEKLDLDSTIPASEWSSGISDTSSAVPSNIPQGWNLEGSVGFPEGFDHLPSHLTTERAKELTPVFTTAIESTNPRILLLEDGTLTNKLFDSITGSHLKEPCKNGIFIPLRSGSGERVLGFMLMYAWSFLVVFTLFSFLA